MTGTGIHVDDVEVIFAPEYETFMQTGFASGSYPNVFYVDSFRLQDWASAGVLEPYGDRITDVEDIYDLGRAGCCCRSAHQR